MSVHALIVIADSELRDSIAQALHDRPIIVNLAADIKEARRCIREQPCDLLIASLTAVGREVADLIRHARERSPNLNCIIVGSDAANDTTLVIAAGATMVIPSGTDAEQMNRLIGDVLDHNLSFIPTDARALIARLQTEGSHRLGLSQRQEQVLLLLAKGLNYSEIGTLTESSINTVRSHVRQLYLKLDVHSKSDAIFKLDNVSGGISAEIASHLLSQLLKRKQDTALTNKETEVLRLMAEGYSYHHLADHMGISINTIRSHVRAIYRKTNTHSNAEAIYEATRMGLLR